MQKEQGFKKFYILVTLVLTLLYGGWHVYFMNFPVAHTLYKKVMLNSLVNLYVTEANAGAMTSFSYQYYLYDAKKSDEDFMSHVKGQTPFMITDDERATAVVKDEQLYLRVRGNIYSYSNTSYRIRIHLDASPY